MSAGNDREFIDYLQGKAREKCPHAITKRAGGESIDLCEINYKICLLESGNECDIYDEWLREGERCR